MFIKNEDILVKRKNVCPLPQGVICGVGSKSHPDIFGAHAGFRINKPSVNIYRIQTVSFGRLGEYSVNRLSVPPERRVVEVGSREDGSFHIVPLRN